MHLMWSRRDFLLNRDGLAKTIQFYHQAINVYGVASRVALGDGKGAKGREWASKYKDAERSCSLILSGLITHKND